MSELGNKANEELEEKLKDNVEKEEKLNDAESEPESEKSKPLSTKSSSEESESESESEESESENVILKDAKEASDKEDDVNKKALEKEKSDSNNDEIEIKSRIADKLHIMQKADKSQPNPELLKKNKPAAEKSTIKTIKLDAEPKPKKKKKKKKHTEEPLSTKKSSKSYKTVAEEIEKYTTTELPKGWFENFSVFGTKPFKRYYDNKKDNHAENVKIAESLLNTINNNGSNLSVTDISQASYTNEGHHTIRSPKLKSIFKDVNAIHQAEHPEDHPSILDNITNCFTNK